MRSFLWPYVEREAYRGKVCDFWESLFLGFRLFASDPFAAPGRAARATRRPPNVTRTSIDMAWGMIASSYCSLPSFRMYDATDAGTIATEI